MGLAGRLSQEEARMHRLPHGLDNSSSQGVCALLSYNMTEDECTRVQGCSAGGGWGGPCSLRWKHHQMIIGVFLRPRV